MLLSIIIPVYNVEDYISTCLKSVLCQNIPYDQYEVIVVNDGTKDDSMKTVMEFSKNYENVRVINQSNQGLSIARNNGLNIAKGKYVWFIDSDDYIENNCLDAISTFLNKDIDLLQIQYQYVYDDSSLNTVHEPCIINQITSGKEQTLKGGVAIPAQSTIYRKQFLLENDLSFFPDIYYEDNEFKPRALYFANKCLSYNKVVYNYYQRAGSITGKFRLKNGLDILQVNSNLIKFISKNNITSPYKEAFYRHISLNLNTLLLGLRQLSTEERNIIIRRLNENKELFHIMLLSKNLKYMVEGLLLLININLGLILHRAFR